MKGGVRGIGPSGVEGEDGSCIAPLRRRDAQCPILDNVDYADFGFRISETDGLSYFLSKITVTLFTV